MRDLLVSWAVLTLALFVATKVVPGVRIRGGAGSHFVVSAIFGVLTVLLQKVLFAVIVVGTLGLGYLLKVVTLLVITTLLLKITDAITDRFKVDGWGPAFFAAIVVTIVDAAATELLRRL